MSCSQHHKKLKRLCVQPCCDQPTRLLCDDCSLTTQHNPDQTISLNRFESDIINFCKLRKKHEQELKKQLHDSLNRCFNKTREQIHKVLDQQLKNYEQRIENIQVSLEQQEEEIVGRVMKKGDWVGMGDRMVQLYRVVTSASYRQLWEKRKQTEIGNIEFYYDKLLFAMNQTFENHRLDWRLKDSWGGQSNHDQTVIMKRSKSNEKADRIKRSSSDKLNRFSPNMNRDLKQYKSKMQSQSYIRKRSLFKPSFIVQIPKKGFSIIDWQKKDSDLTKKIQQNRQAISGSTDSKVLKMIEQKEKSKNRLIEEKLRAVMHEQLQSVVKNSVLSLLQETQKNEPKKIYSCQSSVQTSSRKIIPAKPAQTAPVIKVRRQREVCEVAVQSCPDTKDTSNLPLASIIQQKGKIEDPVAPPMPIFKVNIKNPQGNIQQIENLSLCLNQTQQIKKVEPLKVEFFKKQAPKPLEATSKPTETQKKTSVEWKIKPIITEVNQPEKVLENINKTPKNKQNLDKSKTLNCSASKKVIKKSKAILNEAILDIDNKICLDSQPKQEKAPKVTPVTMKKPSISRQLLSQRLEIIPYTSQFLEKNLLQMEEAWRSFDLMCWSRYFDLKLNNNLDNGDFLPIKKKCKNIKFDHKEIVLGLQANLNQIKITSIKKKKKNELIMRYLILHTVQLIILIQGDKILAEQSIYSHDELTATLHHLQQDELQKVQLFLRTKLSLLLKKCDDNLC